MRRAAPWAVLWTLGILVLTLMPASEVPSWPLADLLHVDKFVHAFLFGVQSVLLGLALADMRMWRSSAQPLVIGLLLAILYGAVIELLQECMGEGRHGDAWDLLADSMGALIGYAFLRWRQRVKA